MYGRSSERSHVKDHLFYCARRSPLICYIATNSPWHMFICSNHCQQRWLCWPNRASPWFSRTNRSRNQRTILTWPLLSSLQYCEDLSTRSVPMAKSSSIIQLTKVVTLNLNAKMKKVPNLFREVLCKDFNWHGTCLSSYVFTLAIRLSCPMVRNCCVLFVVLKCLRSHELVINVLVPQI